LLPPGRWHAHPNDAVVVTFDDDVHLMASMNGSDSEAAGLLTAHGAAGRRLEHLEADGQRISGDSTLPALTIAAPTVFGQEHQIFDLRHRRVRDGAASNPEP
jgi:hypothetical protein